MAFAPFIYLRLLTKFEAELATRKIFHRNHSGSWTQSHLHTATI